MRLIMISYLYLAKICHHLEERQTILQEQSPLVPGPESKNESEIQQEPKPIETKATKKKKRNKSKAKVKFTRGGS